jgi:hypothetical protein
VTRFVPSCFVLLTALAALTPPTTDAATGGDTAAVHAAAPAASTAGAEAADDSTAIQAAAVRALLRDGNVYGAQRICLRESLPVQRSAPSPARQELIRAIGDPRVVPEAECPRAYGLGARDVRVTVSPPSQAAADGRWLVHVGVFCGSRCGTQNLCTVWRGEKGFEGSCRVRAVS